MRRRLEKKGENIRERMRAIAGERRRFGYRRIGVLPARAGMTMNKKKLYRLYREEGLAVKRRRGRKRATGTRARRSSFRRARMSAGRSTSCRMYSGRDDGSAFSPSSTTRRATVSVLSPTRRSQAQGSPASAPR